MTISVVPFADALLDVSRGREKIPSSAFLTEGELAVVDQGQGLVAGYTDHLDAQVRTDAPLIVFGDHTRVFKYIDFPFALGADGVKLLAAREGFLPRYLFRYLASLTIPSAGYSRHFKFLKEVKVPKVSLPAQARVVEVLDHADAIRLGRRRTIGGFDELIRAEFVETFLARGFDSVRLDSIANIHGGGRLKLSGNDFVEHGVPAYGAGGLNGYLDVAEYDDQDAVILSAIGARCGKCFLARGAWTTLANTQVILPKPGEVDVVYLWHLLNDENRWPRSGSAQPFIKPSDVKSHLVPQPPRELQAQFACRVAEIEAQRATAEHALALDDELFEALQDRAFTGVL